MYEEGTSSSDTSFENLRTSRPRITRYGMTHVQRGRLREPNLGLRIHHSRNLSHAYVATYRFLLSSDDFRASIQRRHSGIALTERKYSTPVPSRFAREEAIKSEKTEGSSRLRLVPLRVITITRKGTGSRSVYGPLCSSLKSEVGAEMPLAFGNHGDCATKWTLSEPTGPLRVHLFEKTIFQYPGLESISRRI